jgi:hypothetical protein
MRNAHIDVMMTSSKMQKMFSDPHCFEAILRLKGTRVAKNYCKNATLKKDNDNRLSFPKMYRKIKISFSFFEKIAIEVECFIAKFDTKKHQIREAYFDKLETSHCLPDLYCAVPL